MKVLLHKHAKFILNVLLRKYDQKCKRASKNSSLTLPRNTGTADGDKLSALHRVPSK